MKSCDVCGRFLGCKRRFKYADGWICKECYKKASRNFTETTVKKSLDEIKERCSLERDDESYGNFVITGRIGNYLLVDEKNKRICIPNNRLLNRKVAEPEFYDWAQIKGSRLVYAPFLEQEKLEKKIAMRSDDCMMNFLEVRLTLNDGTERNICFISKPVRVKSYAFRQSFLLAKRINGEINRLVSQ